MNHLLLFPDEIRADGAVRVVGGRAKYLAEFHERLEPGGTLPLLVWERGAGTFTCSGVSPELVQGEASFRQAPPQTRAFSLVQAFCRPQTVKKVLQVSAMMRLHEVIFVASEFGEKSYQGAKIFEADRLRAELVKGLEQVGNFSPPRVRTYSKWRDFLREEATLCGEGALRLVGEPGVPGSNADGSVVARALRERKPFPPHVVLAQGPEKGWSEDELKTLREYGYECHSLGEDHYRIETAFTLALAELRLWEELSETPRARG
ncbi:RsmE family RNA methyltransferase [bacterium]|nr:RsmE family RNA methyltransferase [bacterium]